MYVLWNTVKQTVNVFTIASSFNLIGPFSNDYLKAPLNFALLNKKFRWIVITISSSSNNWKLLIHKNIILMSITPFLTHNITKILKRILITIRYTFIKSILHLIIRNLLLIIVILKACSFHAKPILSPLPYDGQISLWQILNLLIINLDIALCRRRLIHIMRYTRELFLRNFCSLI